MGFLARTFLIKISYKFVSLGLIDNTLSLNQMMSWRHTGDWPVVVPILFNMCDCRNIRKQSFPYLLVCVRSSHSSSLILGKVHLMAWNFNTHSAPWALLCLKLCPKKNRFSAKNTIFLSPHMQTGQLCGSLLFVLFPEYLLTEHKLRWGHWVQILDRIQDATGHCIVCLFSGATQVQSVHASLASVDDFIEGCLLT